MVITANCVIGQSWRVLVVLTANCMTGQSCSVLMVLTANCDRQSCSVLMVLTAKCVIGQSCSVLMMLTAKCVIGQSCSVLIILTTKCVMGQSCSILMVRYATGCACVRDLPPPAAAEVLPVRPQRRRHVPRRQLSIWVPRIRIQGQDGHPVGPGTTHLRQAAHGAPRTTRCMRHQRQHGQYSTDVLHLRHRNKISNGFSPTDLRRFYISSIETVHTNNNFVYIGSKFSFNEIILNFRCISVVVNFFKSVSCLLKIILLSLFNFLKITLECQVTTIFFNIFIILIFRLKLCLYNHLKNILSANFK